MGRSQGSGGLETVIHHTHQSSAFGLAPVPHIWLIAINELGVLQRLLMTKEALNCDDGAIRRDECPTRSGASLRSVVLSGCILPLFCRNYGCLVRVDEPFRERGAARRAVPNASPVTMTVRLLVVTSVLGQFRQSHHRHAPDERDHVAGAFKVKLGREGHYSMMGRGR